MREAAVSIPPSPTNQPSRSILIGWAFFVSGEALSASIKNGESTMANQTNGNQSRDDEIVVLTENRDGKREVKEEYRGKIRFLDEAKVGDSGEHLVMGIAFGPVPQELPLHPTLLDVQVQVAYILASPLGGSSFLYEFHSSPPSAGGLARG
jgi:hypothetical protein